MTPWKFAFMRSITSLARTVAADRMAALWLFLSANTCSPASPSRPNATTTIAIITSSNVKPDDWLRMAISIGWLFMRLRTGPALGKGAPGPGDRDAPSLVRRRRRTHVGRRARIAQVERDGPGAPRGDDPGGTVRDHRPGRTVGGVGGADERVVAGKRRAR